MNHSRNRRHFLQSTLSLGASAALGISSTSRAQQRLDTVRVLCGYPPGGSVDVVSRKLAERLGKTYARVALVDNKTGAAGRLVFDALKASPPDGSVMLVTPGSAVTMYPHIYRPLSYDVFNDLTPVGMVAGTEFCLAVGPAVPTSVRTLDDFSGWCKANPALASCGNAGAGSFPHFMALLVARDTGLPLTHVPYRGGSAAMLALIGGQVTSAMATESAALPLEQSGKLRVLVTTAAERSAFFPKAPSFSELGYKNLAQREWFAVFMPRHAPSALAATVAEEVRSMLMEAEARETWARIGLSTISSTPAELQAALRKEYDFWGPVIKASGFTPES